MILRYLERILAILGGIFAIYLGYQLFLRGMDQGDVQFSFGKFIVSGQGPGIAFMAGGLTVLIYAIHASLKVESRKVKREGKSEEKTETVMQLGHPVVPPVKEVD